MKSYLSTLNEREKWMLFSAVFCILAYIYYLFLYAPLTEKVEQKSTQLIEKKQTLAWMKQVEQQKKSPKKKQIVNNSQLLTLLATQLKNNSALKYPYQLQQTSSGEIQISFDLVPFNLLMQWLTKINEQYLISIKQLDIKKTATPGITQLMIVISAT